MKSDKRFTMAAVFTLLAVLLTAGIGAAVFAQEEVRGYLDSMTRDYAVPEILPPGVRIEQQYAPGAGEPVGVADMVQNDVWIIHAGTPGVAYRTAKEKPVFQGDTIITGRQATCIVTLKDQSSLTLGALTKLVIDKSVYDPAKNERESVFSMLWGKVRCLVRKVASTGRDEDFKVNTPMATLGVRGSDFVVAMVPPEEAQALQRQSLWQRIELVPSAYAASPFATFVATGPKTNLFARPPGGGSGTPVGPNTFLSAFQDRFFTTPFPPGSYSQLLSRMSMAQLPVLRMPELLE